MAGDEPFLTRWSRRKLTTDEAGDADAVPPPDAVDELAPVEADDLPDIDSLDKDSDYTVFLREGVPEEVRRLALRALWRSDPVLANLDGLNDYDEDFADALRVGAEIMRELARAESDGESLEPEGSDSLNADPAPDDVAETGADEPPSSEPPSSEPPSGEPQSGASERADKGAEIPKM